MEVISEAAGFTISEDTDFTLGTSKFIDASTLPSYTALWKWPKMSKNSIFHWFP